MYVIISVTVFVINRGYRVNGRIISPIPHVPENILTMIDQYKREFIEFGTAQLPKFRPDDLDLYKERQLTRLLDEYGNKWVALQKTLNAKKQKIMKRPEMIEIDVLALQACFDEATLTIRNKFTAAYPLNL